MLTDLVRRAHARAMSLLQGDGVADGVSVVNGEVTLNLIPLFGRALTLVQNAGLFSDVQVPDLTRSGDPSEQIAALESALNRDLPDDFGQLVVYRSDQLADAQASLESAQNVLAFAKRALWLLIVTTVLLIVVSLLLARNRWRAALLLGPRRDRGHGPRAGGDQSDRRRGTQPRGQRGCQGRDRFDRRGLPHEPVPRRRAGTAGRRGRRA